MTGKTLTQFRTDLVAMLQSSNTEFPDAQVDISVERAVAELSKFLPREKILDIFIGDRTVTDDSFTSDHGTHVSLANSPIEGLSETVRSATGGGGTLYTLGTDYEMNYFDGTIKTLSTGDISNTTTTYVSYEKHGIVVDISGATNIMEVLSLESPIDGSGFQDIKAFQLWGDKIFIGAGMKESQRKLLENKNFWMYYTTEWTTPVAGTGSEYPAHLDELVSKGALGFLLVGLSVKKTIEATGELALANAELDSTDGVFTSAAGLHTAIGVAADAANAALDAIPDITKFDIAVDAANVSIDSVDHTAILTDIGLTNTDLGAVNWTIFEDVLDHTTSKSARKELEAAVTLLDAVTTEGFGDFDTALTAAVASIISADTAADVTSDLTGDDALDKVAVHTVGASNTVEESETNAQTDLDKAADTYLDNVTAPSAKSYLATGDDKIDSVNIGENVAENYSIYANASIRLSEGLIAAAATHAQLGANRLGVANAYISEGMARISQERLNVEESQALTAVGNAFIAEADQRLSQHRILIQQANGHLTVAESYVNEARSYLDQNLARIRLGDGHLGSAQTRIEDMLLGVQEAISYIAEARVRLDLNTSFMDEAAGYIGEVRARIEWHEAYLAEIDRHIADASMRLRTADGFKLLGESYLALAQTHLAEFFDGLRDRAGMRRQRARASRSQPA